MKPLLGLGLALLGSALNLGAWWAIARLMGSAARAGARPRFGTVLVVLTFLVKLPAFYGLFILARRLGGGAVECFIFGTVLVYFSATTWAALRAHAS